MLIVKYKSRLSMILIKLLCIDTRKPITNYIENSPTFSESKKQTTI